MDPREAFAEQLRARREHVEACPLARGYFQLQGELDEALISRAHELGLVRSRRVKVETAIDRLPKEEFDQTKAPYLKRAEELHRGWKAERDEIDKRLSELAQSVPLCLSIDPEEWRELTQVWDSTYSTQGLGAERYAQNSAEATADVARCHGVPVRIVRVQPKHARRFDGSSYSYGGEWHVLVQVGAQLDVEVLKRLPGPSLREWVRLCWARGVNPRVYQPFLPHGYEEEQGLDYFGHDLRPDGGGR